MILSLNNLIIEVTRRCNMHCEHCLRGAAQNLNIDLKHIDNALADVNYISSLTFTGGEPSLNVSAIKHTLKVCKQQRIDIGGFYIATNGKKITEEFVIICLELYSYCSDKDICQVVYSNDQFHEGRPDLELLNGLSFFSKRYPNNKIENLILEGRAVNIGYPGRSNYKWSRPKTISDFNEAELYLNCRGEIINGCDWSFKNQKKHKLCNADELLNFYNSLENDETN